MMYVVANNNVVGQYCYSIISITTAITVIINCDFESSFLPLREFQLTTNVYSCYFTRDDNNCPDAQGCQPSRSKFMRDIFFPVHKEITNLSLS